MLQGFLNRANVYAVLPRKGFVAQVVPDVLAKIFALPGGAFDGDNIQIKQLRLWQVLAAQSKLARPEQIFISRQSLCK
jgi:hypothetical protein